MPKLGFVQSLMMKKLMNMDPRQREKMMQKAMAPENIAGKRDEILAVLAQLQGSGAVSAEQAEEVKRKMGI